jgi:hypothetical protein
MIEIEAVVEFAFLFAWIIWFIDLLSRSTETPTRLSTVNLKMIEPDV